MEMRFKEAAKNFLSSGKKLQTFRPFPTASMREEYGKLSPWLRKKVLVMGETFLGYQYPAIRAVDFMAFGRTGNRVTYEDIYFARRYALNSLVVAECVENQGRFLDDIINGIFAICEESAWQLPPHNSYQRGVPQDILPDITRPILDLFACETGAQLACIHYLLREQLDAVSPYITKRIRFELEQRIITPYLKEHFWWMGQGEEPMCNWTPWCTQNVLFTAFLWASFSELPGYTEEIGRAIILKAAESCDYFLKDYGEDGCCDEGAQYYRHAGLCLDGAASVLNQVTDGAFTELMQWDKIKNIAAYIYNVHVEGKYYFNFADCSPVAGRAGIREYLFGKHTRQPGLMQFAAEDFRAAKEEMFADESHQLNLFYRLQAMFCVEEIMAFSPGEQHLPKDIYYPSVGLFLARNDTFNLAVKAGDNDDNHNHNDVGSITLYKNGQPVLVDIGVESYTQKTFSSNRYEIWTMQSCYHNLPTIDGLDQHNGAAYHATKVVTSLSPDFAAQDALLSAPTLDEKQVSVKTNNINSDKDALISNENAFISMELARAYPLPDLKCSYVRQVVFDKKGNRILLTDHTNSRDVILNFITYEKPQITEHSIKIGAATLTFRGAYLLAVEVLPITDKRLQSAWEHDLYRLRLKMDGNMFEMIIL